MMMYLYFLKFVLIFLLYMGMMVKPFAETYTLDSKDSEVSFSGKHAGMAFSGIFETWKATLVLPPADEPKIIAQFQLNSAKTGDFTYDSTLPEGDWFDAENHPVGKFESSKINAVENGYEVVGMLTLRGISNPQEFTLIESKRGFSAQFSIDRLDYKIGFDSDPEAEWVSREIVMRLDLVK